MLPPPAITTRRTGSSRLRISLITRRMSLVAARKNTSSPDSITVSPSGLEAPPVAVDRDHARIGVGQMLADVAQLLPDQQPALHARAHRPAGPGRPRNRRSAARPDSGSAARMYVVTSCFGTHVHVDGEARPPAGRRSILRRYEQLGAAREVRGADARDPGRACRTGSTPPGTRPCSLRRCWSARRACRRRAAPACSSVRGLARIAADGADVERSCRSRSTSSSTSTTVTSLASSRARWYAAVRPTWPAPRMMIFTVGDLSGSAPF